MPIKSFRGLIGDDTVEEINLHTNDGKTGYKIVKFEILSKSINVNLESTVKIYSVSQTAANVDVDFSDQTLLGAATFNQAAQQYYNPGTVVVFDNIIFNQDIFVTHKCHDNSGPINYHIELEQVKLDLPRQTVATLKDIRNIKAQ